MDGRFISRKGLFYSKRSEKRQLVIEFLQELHDTLAEPMPTAPRQVGGESIKLPNLRPLRSKRPRAFLKRASGPTMGW